MSNLDVAVYSAGSNSLNSYLWSNGSTANILEFIATMDTTVWVAVTTPNGCFASDTVEVTVILGLGEPLVSESKVKIYPNPTRQKLHVKILGWKADRMEISILDLAGKLVIQKQVQTGSGNEIFEFDLNDLAKGVYFIKIFDGSIKATKKVVLQ